MEDYYEFPITPQYKLNSERTRIFLSKREKVRYAFYSKAILQVTCEHITRECIVFKLLANNNLRNVKRSSATNSSSLENLWIFLCFFTFIVLPITLSETIFYLCGLLFESLWTSYWIFLTTMGCFYMAPTGNEFNLCGTYI